MEITSLHLWLSVITALFSIAAVLIARWAMHRGLTYLVVAAVVWTLTFISIAMIWHSAREILGVGGELGEMIDYSIHIVAFVIFIWLTYKAAPIKTA